MEYVYIVCGVYLDFNAYGDSIPKCDILKVTNYADIAEIIKRENTTGRSDYTNVYIERHNVE